MICFFKSGQPQAGGCGAQGFGFVFSGPATIQPRPSGRGVKFRQVRPHQSTGFVFSAPTTTGRQYRTKTPAFFRYVIRRKTAAKPEGMASMVFSFAIFASLREKKDLTVPQTAVGHSFSRKLPHACASKRRAGLGASEPCGACLSGCRRPSARRRRRLESRRHAESHTPRRAWEVN
jgi:hypothetical protein